MIELVTIGVYGADENQFFDALQRAGVDTFCDIRWRRGMRGREYAFANSARLQQRLGEMGIRYVHVRDVAPSPDLRKAQAKADKEHRIARRKRTVLGNEFVEGYCRDVLAKLESQKFIAQFGPDAKVVALFCVEREPAACHRSLLAERLEKDLDVKVAHIIPGGNR
ncbi:MAG TPA: DUF488 domain-containing protein [Verrucomicrobiae bacterium]|nr:DUF488 domain-containing protein [Verrucomicrobiae bacterium]